MNLHLGYNRNRLQGGEVNVTFNGNKINLPKSVTLKFRDKFTVTSNDPSTETV